MEPEPIALTASQLDLCTKGSALHAAAHACSYAN
jgi:hypothetical protein